MQRLIRVGKVSTVNSARGTVRVTFPDRDNMVSGELPVLSIGGIFKLPSVGEPAICLFLDDSLGSGFYLGTYYPGGENLPDASQGAVVTGDLLISSELTVSSDLLVSGDVTISGLLHGGGVGG